MDLKSIVNSPQAANTLLVVSAEDLRNLLDDAMKFAIRTIKERDEPDFYTRDELADKLHITLVTLGRWREKGYLPEPLTVDGRVLFDKKKVREALDSHYKTRRKLIQKEIVL